MGEGVEDYTIAEAARRLRVSQATVWRWIHSRRLRAYRVGPRRIRIREQDLGAVVRPVGEDIDARDAEEERRGPADPFSGYDAGRTKEALRRSAGALRGIDRERLLDDLRAEREQHGSARPR